MSVLPSEADVHQGDGYVSFVPKGDFTKSAAYGARPTFWLDDEIG